MFAVGERFTGQCSTGNVRCLPRPWVLSLLLLLLSFYCRIFRHLGLFLRFFSPLTGFPVIIRLEEKHLKQNDNSNDNNNKP